MIGAIAQLVERVLCKHEVVGSIPSGSTILRPLCGLRLGKPCWAADEKAYRAIADNKFPVTAGSAG